MKIVSAVVIAALMAAAFFLLNPNVDGNSSAAPAQSSGGLF